MDPFVASARYVLKQSVEDLRRSLDGLEADALNWRPAADTVSIAVLAVHVLSSTRWWLSVATGVDLPDRDRDSEFVASAASGDSLRAWFEDMARQCDALLDTREPIDWSAQRRPDPDDAQEASAAFALLHALQHLREHEGQMSLTRQLWEGRN